MKDNKKRFFASIGNVDDRWISESELPERNHSSPLLQQWTHFWNSAAGVILLCVLVSGAVLSGILYAGWRANTPSSTPSNDTAVPTISPDAPVERQGDLYYVNHGDGTCTLVGIAALPQDMSLTIPAVTPNGQTVIAIGDMTDAAQLQNLPNGYHLFLVESVSIPATVRSIHVPSLQAMEGLWPLTIDEGNPYYRIQDDFLIQNDGNVLLYYWNTHLNESASTHTEYEYTGSPTMSSIPRHSTKVYISIPDNVQAIATNAFTLFKATRYFPPPNNSFYDPTPTVLYYWTIYINIPASVTNIQEGFSNYNHESWVGVVWEVDPQNPAYYSENHCVIQKDGAVLLCGESSDIPQGVRAIAPYAFRHTDFSTISIPDSVEKIGFMAFADSSQLAKIQFQGTQDQWDAIDKDDTWLHGNTLPITIDYATPTDTQ